jgi:hypothetical protein
MDAIRKITASTALYVLLYVVFMIPTYLLPYFGSNSLILTVASAESGQKMVPFFLHIITLLILIALAWYRGAFVGKTWLVVLPVLAAVFDMTPGLSIIPLIPTALHLGAIIVGASGTAVLHMPTAEKTTTDVDPYAGA